MILAVNVKTYTQYLILMTIFGRRGLRWECGNKAEYFKRNELWEEHKEQTCITYHKGYLNYADIGYCASQGHKILTLAEFEAIYLVEKKYLPWRDYCVVKGYDEEEYDI